jgi:hypothetical protein
MNNCDKKTNTPDLVNETNIDQVFEEINSPRPEYTVDRVKQMGYIQDNALEIFKKKNADYGDAFATFGLIGILTRIEDKIQRCLNISKNSITLIETESLEDTLLDLHNYSAMGLMLLQDEKINKMKDKINESFRNMK